MHMKLLFVLSLILNIAGYGDVPAEGAEITVNEAQLDLLTGEPTMELSGNLLCESVEPLTVSLTRSATGLVDQFCCAEQCINGNGQQSESLLFSPVGITDWFIHYVPAPGSYETIVYRFDDGTDRPCVLTVHFDYTAQALPATSAEETAPRKILRNGILYIIRNQQTYTVL